MAAGNSLALKDLSPAVRKTIDDSLKGGQIRNIGKQTGNGVARYEVETPLDAIPAAAKAAILTCSEPESRDDRVRIPVPAFRARHCDVSFWPSRSLSNGRTTPRPGARLATSQSGRMVLM